MIYYKTEEEVELIRKSCLLVCKALSHVASLIKPGVTGVQMDAAAEELIKDHGALPAFKGYRGFPGTLCISLNDQVVHGIPTNQEFKDGDIVSIDCGTYMNNFFGDSAYTFALGEISKENLQLLEVTNTSLYKGIAAAVAGQRIGDIGFAVQSYCESTHKYGVVRELVGHGIGRSLHEAPEVPNYGKRGRGSKLKEGLVIAIEPMVNRGKKEVKQLDDGWTVATKDGTIAAHYEHTICVQKGKALILSDHDLINAEIDKNTNVNKIAVRSSEMENV